MLFSFYGFTMFYDLLMNMSTKIGNKNGTGNKNTIKVCFPLHFFQLTIHNSQLTIIQLSCKPSAMMLAPIAEV